MNGNREFMQISLHLELILKLCRDLATLTSACLKFHFLLVVRFFKITITMDYLFIDLCTLLLVILFLFVYLSR